LEIDHYNRFVYEARGRSKTSVLPAQIDCTIPVASSPSVSPSELSFKCLLSRDVHLTRTFKLPSGNKVLKVPISFRQLSSKVASSGPYHLPREQTNTSTPQHAASKTTGCYNTLDVTQWNPCSRKSSQYSILPPENGVVARKRPPGQALVQRLLLVFLEAEEAAAVLIHDLRLKQNSR
jgi:hypothetical protein